MSLRAPAEPFRTSFAFPGVGFGLAALIGTGDTLGVEAAEYCAISAVAGGLTKRASMFSVSILLRERRALMAPHSTLTRQIYNGEARNDEPCCFSHVASHSILTLQIYSVGSPK